MCLCPCLPSLPTSWISSNGSYSLPYSLMHLLGLWHTSSADLAGSLSSPPLPNTGSVYCASPTPQALSPTSTPQEPQLVAPWCCRVPHGQPGLSQILHIPSSAKPAASRSTPFFLWPVRLSFFFFLPIIAGTTCAKVHYPKLMTMMFSAFRCHSLLQCQILFLKAYSIAQEKSISLILATGQQFQKPLNSTFKAF